jgi:transcriptional regulator with XRE-family HTH domain
MKKQTHQINSIKDVGMRVKAVRDKLNLKQGAYATKLGISQSFLSYIEKGLRKPSYELLLSLLSNFKVNLHWIVTGVGDMFIPDTNPEQQVKEKFSRLFPGVPPDQDVLELVKNLEVPIIKNALMEKYLLYRKKYEDFIREHHRKKQNQGRENQNESH